MMHINNIIHCPKCKQTLSEDFRCSHCGIQYQFVHGVYQLISNEVTQSQTSQWKITDEMLENPDAFLKRELQEKDWEEDYQAKKNAETKEAEKKLNEYTDTLLQSLSGTVLDLATGMGRMLRKVLDANQSVNVVCTDIDPRILAWTRIVQKTDDKRVAYVAADGRELPFSNDCFDYVTSFAAFGNIPDSDKVARELYRVLKKNGQLLIQGGYIEKGSKSHELAKQYHLEQGLLEENLIACLREAGFTDIDSHIVATAVWEENPYDLLPVAGDIQKYCVIRATKHENPLIP